MTGTTVSKPQGLVYDDRDIHYLAGLGMEQLKHERWHARLELSTAKYYQMDEHPDEWPGEWGEDLWAAYLDLVEKTIKHLQASQVKPHWNPKGHIDIAALKTSSDIVEVAERYTTLKKAGSRFTGCCPVHTEKSPSFFVFPEDQTWHCFGCNKGGDVISLVMAVEHLDFMGACRALQNT